MFGFLYVFFLTKASSFILRLVFLAFFCKFSWWLWVFVSASAISFLQRLVRKARLPMVDNYVWRTVSETSETERRQCCVGTQSLLAGSLASYNVLLHE